jgi:sigma-B regulation protein RsbU (phosphoserine phosphatase)
LPQLTLTRLDEEIQEKLDGKTQIFGTPVLVKNVEQGRLYVFNRDPEYVWTPTRRKLAQLVADQTAVAIANHELTVELRSKERQDRELEIASEIQLRLLPTKCPQIQGVELAAECKTANRVGGDYYDFIPTNYDQIGQRQSEHEEASLVPWSIVIGDVMGKGVPAGLIMTMTRGMLRAEVLNRHTPAQIMQHLNRVMYADLENSHRFVSMFYSEYDPKTQILSFTNAAHNPPLWWQASTNSLHKLDTWGMLIGLDPESEYEDDRVKLASGDTIIYYTDGFTDAVNPTGDRFDEENLCRAFRWACQHLDTTQEILEYLFDEIERFTGRTSQNGDDMTLIVMRVK